MFSKTLLGLAGDLHFDEDEQFDVNGSDTKVDLNWLSLHELGHSLGLDHSYHPDSVMFPFYLGYLKDLTLHWDDIEGIQQLYGEHFIKTAFERMLKSANTLLRLEKLGKRIKLNF